MLLLFPSCLQPEEMPSYVWSSIWALGALLTGSAEEKINVEERFDKVVVLIIQFLT